MKMMSVLALRKYSLKSMSQLKAREAISLQAKKTTDLPEVTRVDVLLTYKWTVSYVMIQYRKYIFIYRRQNYFITIIK